MSFQMVLGLWGSVCNSKSPNHSCLSLWPWCFSHFICSKLLPHLQIVSLKTETSARGVEEIQLFWGLNLQGGLEVDVFWMPLFSLSKSRKWVVHKQNFNPVKSSVHSEQTRTKWGSPTSYQRLFPPAFFPLWVVNCHSEYLDIQRKLSVSSFSEGEYKECGKCNGCTKILLCLCCCFLNINLLGTVREKKRFSILNQGTWFTNPGCSSRESRENCGPE